MRCRALTTRGTREADRAETISPFGLMAMVVALHLSVFARRFSVRSSPVSSPAFLIWRMPLAYRLGTYSSYEEAASRPVREYCFGQLALSLGIAVVALAAWLHVMHLNGVPVP